MTEQQRAAAIQHMEGAKPKFRKGIYGKQYDNHTCGYCGAGMSVIYNYCPTCGTRALWESPRCLTGQDDNTGPQLEGQISITEWMEGKDEG